MNWLTEKIIDYHEKQLKINKKCKLVDILENDITENSYVDMVVDLAVNGYSIKFLKGNTKDKIGLGVNIATPYSYFELEKNNLKIEHEKQRSELVILQNELKQLKEKHNNKAGQKSFDNKDIIKKIFDSYKIGKSLKQIAEKLNELGVETKRGGKWHKSTIKGILGNKEYVNIVGDTLFNNIQELLKSKKKNKVQ